MPLRPTAFAAHVYISSSTWQNSLPCTILYQIYLPKWQRDTWVNK